jgi:hypothetical protein
MALLEHYYSKYLVEEAERPALAKVREHMQLVFHPDSRTMKSFERGEEDSRIEAQPVTEFDPDAALPFAGLDAPFGG